MKSLKTYIIEKLDINNINLNNSRAGSDNPDDFKVGDILVSIFSYSMILVEFYKVIKKSGAKTFYLERIGQNIVSGDGMRGTCEPNEKIGYMDEPLKVMVGRKDGKLREGKSGGYHAMYIYDNKPVAFDHMD